MSRRVFAAVTTGPGSGRSTVTMEFLVATYAVVWLGVIIYVFSLSRRSRNLERELQELRDLLGRRGPSA